MKKNYFFILVTILFSLVKLNHAIILEGALIGGLVSFGAYFGRCKFYECCDDEYIPRQTFKLKQDLNEKLYGQQIAVDLVFSAIHSHVHHENPRKPLVLSFHGLPGSGKNYVVTMIVNSLFKLGEKSNYYHFFNGRSDFPSDENVSYYKIYLQNVIQAALSKCERSVFVFDEVDKMPQGLLDILVPFIDYTSYGSRKKSKSIFIFLSNTGSHQILDRMINIWESGRDRNNATILDFESLIAIGAFNEDGGLFRSSTIESRLIDHYVPFLPLERKHVIMCIKDAFAHFSLYDPSEQQIQSVLSHVTFGPNPHNLYSTSGCKRLDYKVASVVHASRGDFV
ncbi:torsin-1A-like [Trichogramma pretiosum]|uniref:torsin-1A-like n=1 Tax=Trichogramma pretiosum TaxID=7493 RepID=UPI0006C9D6AB|nr:torsin-1A-like [Trichogramma pretiosum]